MKYRLLGSAIAAALICSATPVAAQAVLDRITAKGQITVGYRSDAAPFSMDVTGKSKPEGFAMGFCNAAIAAIDAQIEEQELEVSFADIPVDRVIQSLEDGAIELLCSATSITEARQQRVAFSSSIYVVQIKVAVPSKSEIISVESLTGDTIVALSGTSTLGQLAELAQRYDWKVTEAISEEAAIGQLKLGWAQGYARDGQLLAQQLGRLSDPSQYVILPETISTEPIALAMPQGDLELVKIVNQAIAEYVTSGAANADYQRWLAPEQE
jgi:glutamate/aspartate transport system substrate-binding protein